MSVVIVIQARLASSRLPGKVLLPAAGRPLLEHMLRRVQAAEYAERVVVATTTDPGDDAIAALCEALQVECYRGDPLDCLDRHVQIGLQTGASAVVKIPSDCPLIDPAAIDRVLSAYHANPHAYDYVSNLHPATWPDGNDVEVITLAALTAAAQETQDPFDREHTTPYVWLRPERFRALDVRWETGLDYSQTQRWVVDWIEDYHVVRALIETLEPRHGALFTTQHILQLLAERPDLAAMNAGHRGYNYFAARASAEENRQ
jgi:spore coat polysaccharide biosynthesis protein SpsF